MSGKTPIPQIVPYCILYSVHFARIFDLLWNDPNQLNHLPHSNFPQTRSIFALQLRVFISNFENSEKWILLLNERMLHFKNINQAENRVSSSEELSYFEFLYEAFLLIFFKQHLSIWAHIKFCLANSKLYSSKIAKAQTWLLNFLLICYQLSLWIEVLFEFRLVDSCLLWNYGNPDSYWKLMIFHWNFSKANIFKKIFLWNLSSRSCFQRILFPTEIYDFPLFTSHLFSCENFLDYRMKIILQRFMQFFYEISWNIFILVIFLKIFYGNS